MDVSDALRHKTQGDSPIPGKSLGAGKLHPVWHLTPCDRYDLKLACIKAKIIAGSYWLGIDNARSGNRTNMMCPLCEKETEDLEHLLLRCQETVHIGNIYMPLIQQCVNILCASDAWSVCSTDDLLLKLLLDVNLVDHLAVTVANTMLYTQ